MTPQKLAGQFPQDGEFLSINDPLLDTALRIRMSDCIQRVFYLQPTLGAPEKIEPVGDSIPMSSFSLRLETKEILATAYRHEREFSDDLSRDMMRFNVDAKTLAIRSIMELIQRNARKTLVELYDSLGKSHLEKWTTKRQAFFRRWFKVEPKHYLENYRDLGRKLWLYSSMIATSSRRGGADFVILSPEFAAYLQDDPTFIFSPSTEFPSNLIGTYHNLQVFVDYFRKDNVVTLGRTTREQDQGVVFGEYSRSVRSLKLPPMASFETKEVVSVVSQDVIDVIGNEEHARYNYLTIELEVKKKPWLRKFLKI
jgi:hypothetical protein